MLPFEAPTIFEQLPRFFFKMPRVVQDQKSKFESDELFRRISRESEVRYTGFRDRPLQERQIRFQNACREGHTELAFTSIGCNLSLIFNPCIAGYSDGSCDFDKEHGKVHIRSHFIMNGVCVRFRGWLDLDRLDGVGCVEYDELNGSIEEARLKEQMEIYQIQMRQAQENERRMKEHQAAFEAELRKKHPRHDLSPERTSSASN